LQVDESVSQYAAALIGVELRSRYRELRTSR
jgi:hypothetical protein